MPRVTKTYERKNNPTTIRLTDIQEKIVKKHMEKLGMSKSETIGKLIEKGNSYETKGDNE